MGRKNSRVLFAVMLCALIFGVKVPAGYAAAFRERLSELPGVVSVDEIVQSGEVFAEKYVVWFEQPIDWRSPDIGTFLQRAEIGFSGWDAVNVVNVDGYELYEGRFTIDDRVELAKMYNVNYINIEYRYFAKSAPEGLSKKSTALWEYLTDENASNDFHSIMEQLRGILSGTWVFTGTSKGGQMTNIFSYYYPDDADAYVAYVGPFCDGTNDERLMDAVYTSIGNDRYGEAQAKIYRDMLLEFQVEAIRNREYLQPRLIHALSSDDAKLYPFRTVSRDFDSFILDYAVWVWQYDQDFAAHEKILNMPREDNPATEQNEREEYLLAMLALLSEDVNPDEDSLFPYIVQAATENGDYAMKFKYLREAVEREGLSLAVTEEDEKNFTARMTFTEEQQKVFTFDPYMRNELLNWSHTTQSNVIMIYGSSDPWYFVRLPDVDDNPNVHIFTTPLSHIVRIADVSEDKKAQITGLLDSWLMSESELPSSVGSSSGGCDSGFGAAVLILVFAVSKNRTKN
ncbi:MAG: hypothetical protein IJP54_06420 [Synergistaceae bacterium]|nr:hypothetical protein [Synergistaceae bacterium]